MRFEKTYLSSTIFFSSREEIIAFNSSLNEHCFEFCFLASIEERLIEDRPFSLLEFQRFDSRLRREMTRRRDSE